MFDSANKESFENLERWLASISLHATLDNPTIMIIANKRDLLDEREVTILDLEHFTSKHNKQIMFSECSARTGY